MNLTKLREHVAGYGVRETAQKVVSLIREDKLPLEAFSLRSAWEAFIGPVEDTLPRVMRSGGLGVSPLVEEVRSGAFAHVTQNVIAKKLQDAYASVPSRIDELVTVVPSSFKTEKMVGFTAMDGPKDVAEGQEYDETGFSDRATTAPEPMKRGRAISITDEAVRFDQTGQIMARAGQYGRKMAMDREKYGMNAIQDIAGYYSFYPHVSGVATRSALYHNATAAGEWYNVSDNLAETNALADWTDLQADFNLFAAMKDEGDDYILIQPTHLLVPNALLPAAAHILSSIEVTTGVAMSVNAQIEAMGLSNIKIVASQYLDAQAVGTWYLGDFKSQFIERVLIPTEVKQVAGDPRRDIVVTFIARRKSSFEAIDDKFVIKNSA